MISCWLFGVSREKMRRTLAPGIGVNTPGDGREMGWRVGGFLVQNVYIFQVATTMAMMMIGVTITVSEIAKACGEIGCEFNGDMEGVGEMWLVLECGWTVECG